MNHNSLNRRASLVINARVTAFAMGGQQRVAAEIMKRIPDAELLVPSKPLGGIKGHAWEQLALPLKTKGRLLWSPSTTGPLLCKNQVVTVHDTAFFDVPEFFSPSFVKLYQQLVPRLVRSVAKVVTVSEFSRQQLSKTTGLAADRIDVIHNGVATHFKPYAEHDIAATRMTLDLPDRYILVQATSDRRKNLARTLDAWRKIANSLPADLHLVVSGNLGRSHVFGESTLDLAGPRIRLIGYVAEEHMGPLMAGAEALAFASLYEGFGLPVVEAMAAGTPVITGNNSALPEVAGGAALLVDATSTQAIAQALHDIILHKGLAENLVLKGLQRAKAFTWEDAALRYTKAFNEVLRTRNGQPVERRKPAYATTS